MALIVATVQSDCTPKPIFLNWDKVRSYLVHKTELSIPGSWVGTPLKINRCLEFLSPCESNYCGFSSVRDVERNMTLTKNGKKVGYINLHFEEDDQCICMPKMDYQIRVDDYDSLKVRNRTLIPTNKRYLYNKRRFLYNKKYYGHYQY